VHGVRHGIVVCSRKICFVSAICGLTVSFSKSFLYFMRIHTRDYFVCNRYSVSAQRLRPNVQGRQYPSNYSTSVEALYHDVRRAEKVRPLADLIFAIFIV
jgi:hypothetical protein